MQVVASGTATAYPSRENEGGASRSDRRDGLMGDVRPAAEPPVRLSAGWEARLRAALRPIPPADGTSHVQTVQRRKL